MTKAKHTPGPWKWKRIKFGGRDYAEIVTEADEAPVCGDADHALMVAAPELLESLKRIAMAAESAACNVEWVARHARAAIAKTEEQS